jgi:dihydroorotase
VEFDLAANGISGLETSLALSLSLVRQGVISIDRLVEAMSLAPARILGLPGGITIGGPADITVIDPDMVWRVNTESFHSLGKNTPFKNWELRGKAVLTMVGGGIVYNGLGAGAGNCR